MPRDPRHDILFEPVAIGPKTLRNRFYQTPHCSGFGADLPGAQAHVRGHEGRGRLGRRSTPSSARSIPPATPAPLVSARLWDDQRRPQPGRDGRPARTSTARWPASSSGTAAASPATSRRRLPARSVTQMTDESLYSTSCYEMDKADIRELQGYYVAAAKRARDVGVRHHQRPRRRVRRDHPALPDGQVQPPHRRVRRLAREPRPLLARDDRAGSRGGRRRLRDHRAALRRHAATTARSGSAPPRRPTVSSSSPITWSTSGTCRPAAGSRPSGPATTRSPRGSRESSATASTSRRSAPRPRSRSPAVGRFTNPDTMAEAIRSGVLDIIGAARPSIADPFLPQEDRRGPLRRDPRVHRLQHLRLPLRRRARRSSARRTRRSARSTAAAGTPSASRRPPTATKTVLVVGAGPAGMECAMVLGKRGMQRRPPASTSRTRSAACAARHQRLPGPRRVGARDQLPPDPARQARATSR